MVNIPLNLLAGLYFLTAVAAEEPVVESRIPTCAQTCFDDAGRDSGCGVSNPTCLCIKAGFIFSIEDCLKNECAKPENLENGLDALRGMCGDVSGTPTNTSSHSKSHTAETTSVANSTQISTTSSSSSILPSVSKSISKSTLAVSPSISPNTAIVSTTSPIDSTTTTNSVPGRTLPPATGTALEPSTTVILSTSSGPAPSGNAAYRIISVPHQGWLGGVMVMLGFAVI
ncbi:hypothetical protein BDZ94DRAFT_1274360 [Collybia nuda]|uniref:CFEM domain-containing protein n=1 Tax=Collybia nuda TaxID=64659 RepID=A0A9P5XWH2_9AGAR|nr:hypothetical protein BDZ94DRAFT_1274360 [Collybia nuda]